MKKTDPVTLELRRLRQSLKRQDSNDPAMKFMLYVEGDKIGTLKVIGASYDHTECFRQGYRYLLAKHGDFDAIEKALKDKQTWAGNAAFCFDHAEQMLFTIPQIKAAIMEWHAATKLIDGILDLSRDKEITEDAAMYKAKRNGHRK